MNRLAFRIPRALENVFDHERYSRYRFKNGLALAVSGGADSMALACLAKHHFQGDDHPHTKVVAFIVDHGLRDESASEARAVKKYVEDKIGLPATILQATELRKRLDQSSNTNIETRARQARFRLLSDACISRNIEHLLIAHHIADDYESVLLRRAVRAGILSLSLKPEHAMPVFSHEDAQTYGLRLSGTPTDLKLPQAYGGIKGFEGGGVNLLRPLLKHTKEDLVQMLQDNDMWWAEDSSNKDVSLTMRNALRSLDQKTLPTALQRDYVLSQANAASELYDKYLHCAQQCFARSQLKFDPILGRLYACPPSWEGIQWHISQSGVGSPKIIIAFLLRLYADIVDRGTTSSVQDFGRFVPALYPQTRNESASKIDFDRKPDFNWSTPNVKIKPFTVKPGIPWPQLSLAKGPADTCATFYLMLEGTAMHSEQAKSPEMNLAIPAANAKDPLFRERGGKPLTTEPKAVILNRLSQGMIGRGDSDGTSVVRSIPSDAPILPVKAIPYLFDNRYWISVANPTVYGVTMRAATRGDFEVLRAYIDNNEVEFSTDKSRYGWIAGQGGVETNIRRLLGLSLGHLTNAVIPVLVASHRNQSVSDEFVAKDKVIGFPTLGVRFTGLGIPIKQMTWTARYKACDFYGHHLQDILLAPRRPDLRHKWHLILTSTETQITKAQRMALMEIRSATPVHAAVAFGPKRERSEAERIQDLATQVHLLGTNINLKRRRQKIRERAVAPFLSRDQSMGLIWSGAVPEAETPVWSHWEYFLPASDTDAHYDDVGFDNDPHFSARARPYTLHDDVYLPRGKPWKNFDHHLWLEWQPRIDFTTSHSKEEPTLGRSVFATRAEDEFLDRLNDIMGVVPEVTATAPTLYKEARELRELAANSGSRKLLKDYKKQQAIADNVANWARGNRRHDATKSSSSGKRRGSESTATGDMSALMDTVFASLNEPKKEPKSSSWNALAATPEKQSGKDSFDMLRQSANKSVNARDNEAIAEEVDDLQSKVNRKTQAKESAAVTTRKQQIFDLEDLSKALAGVDFDKSSKSQPSQPSQQADPSSSH